MRPEAKGRIRYRDTRLTDAGFTLVELLAVAGLIVLMLSLLIPAVNSLTTTAGRRGAIDQLLGMFDQSRVVALQTSSKVFVGFADSTFPEPDMRYRSYIVFRPRLESDDPPEGTAGVSPYVYLTKWEKLPTGVSFKSGIEFSLLGETGSSKAIVPEDRFPRMPSGVLPVLEYGSHGGILKPESQYLKLFLYEGFYDAGKDVVTRRQDELLDVITLARFTGRPRLEVSSFKP